MSRYGKVRYVGEAPYYTTRGYEDSPPNEPNPEGCFLYDFNPQVYELPIMTRYDLEHFVQRPKLFEVVQPSGKPVRRSTFSIVAQTSA